MSTDTVETEATEAPVSDTPEPTEAEKAAEAAKLAELEKANEALFTDYAAAVASALDERDSSTGSLPAAPIENVKAKFRALPGAKYKNRAKKHLSEALKGAVNTTDLILGVAVMALSDAVDNAGSAPRENKPKEPVDPTAVFRNRLTVAHLAYLLVRENPADGVDASAEFAAVEEKVGSLTEAAQGYYAWLTSTADDKGDEPEVDTLVKQAVKQALGKSTTARKSGDKSTTPRVASDGPRRNVRVHISQAFAILGKGANDTAKISEIAKVATEEYPAADCSPGAISAALKSTKGVEGFALGSDESGHAVARKL